MSENVQVVSPHGEFLPDVCEYEKVHREGIWHATSHVWICVGYQHMVFQLRSRKKDNFPLHWDVSAAGHIRHGESSMKAASREVNEELGLVVDPEALIYLGKVPHEVELKDGAYLDREWAELFLLHIPDFNFNGPSEEVEDIKLVSLKQWEKFISEPASQCVPHAVEYGYLNQLINKNPLFRP